MIAKPRAKRFPKKLTKRPILRSFGPEAYLCSCIMQWVDQNVNRFPVLKNFFHISNEGKRSQSYARGMGINKGVSDYHCPAQHKGLPSLWLEVKAGKNTLTEDQKKWLDDMREAGNWASCQNTFQGCIDYIEIWCTMIDAKTKELAK